MQRLQIFAVQTKGQLQLGLLRNPRHLSDLVEADSRNSFVLTPPLSSSSAYAQLERWRQRLGGKFGLLWRKFLAFQPRYPQGEEPFHPQGDLTDVLSGARALAAGRLVSEERLARSLRERGFWPADISRALDLGVFRGELNQLPGFRREAWGSWVCTRCNSADAAERPCVVCGKQECLICLSCLSMGSNRGCSTFFNCREQPRSKAGQEVFLLLPHKLSPAQAGAAQELVEFWKAPQRKALIWAACGAGKTEVTFALIRFVLSEGGQVLFAIPRREIVREIAERLRRAFPQLAVASHYGGRPWLAPGNLVIATTHQVLHFYHRFQLAILDEADAFPYHGNEMLRFGVERALEPGGKLVEMTATPFQPGKYQRVITIPARYHGHPLPVPRLILAPIPFWETVQGEDLPPPVLKLLSKAAHPWLIFAPTIRACETLRKILSAALNKPVGICHSKAADRPDNIEQFRSGAVDVLVSTSVLERGVNFPQAGVIVFYADHQLFRLNALVQMAGRAGRDHRFLEREVLFVAQRKTPQIKRALQLIEKLNREAKEKGLLNDENAQ